MPLVEEFHAGTAVPRPPQPAGDRGHVPPAGCPPARGTALPALSSSHARAAEGRSTAARHQHLIQGGRSPDHPRRLPVSAGLGARGSGSSCPPPPRPRRHHEPRPQNGAKKSFARAPPASGSGRGGAASPPCPRHRGPAAPCSPPRAPHPYNPGTASPALRPCSPRQRPPPRPGDPRWGDPGPAPHCPRRPPAPRTAGLPTATAIAVRCCARRCAAARRRRLCAAC